ncbi:hypothetical protein FB45DRAFT_888318 [Roridomyces roridus]|uniref:Uncharacterized protein n=1 Tax=Roridomyces roridus TaxID=1738132 RepID=A0AAD7CMA3_9AGAR|nr:hypothetical protein FB45DRAFT_888318 [Roridomyces roridus]
MRTCLFAALLFSFAAAQTVTVTDGAGDVIVEVLTTDADGDPTTSIVSTVLPTAFTSTITATDPAGDVVQEQIIGDGDGNTQTQILQTLTPAGAAAANTPFTSTITTTNAAQQTVIEQLIGDGDGNTQTTPLQTLAAAGGGGVGGGGPVGQPDPDTATAGAPTPYTYTTVIGGVTTAVLATFTPSIATGVAPSATFKATVLNYSQYLASYATIVQTQLASNNNNNAAFSLSPSWLGVGLSMLTSVVGGAILILGA